MGAWMTVVLGKGKRAARSVARLSASRARLTQPVKSAAQKRREAVLARQVTAKAKVVETLASALSPAEAARAAGIAYGTMLQWKAQDAVFSTAWDHAFEEGTDKLEDLVTKRATLGTKRPVYQAGRQVGEETKYSDELLLALLARRRPSAWRKTTVLTGPDGGPVQVQAVRERILGKLAALSGPDVGK
jgi:hypothetical protein